MCRLRLNTQAEAVSRVWYENIHAVLASPRLHRAALASIDQALNSAVSFLIAILLIKYATKNEYGYYSIAFSLSLFLVAVQKALVTTPLSVLLAGKDGAEKDRYVRSLRVGQVRSLGFLACAGMLTMVVLYAGDAEAELAYVGAALCIATMGILQREFVRALFYAEQAAQTVLKLDILYAVLYIALVVLIGLFTRMNAVQVVLLMGVSALFAAMAYTRGMSWKCEWAHIRAAYGENWKYGKWSLLSLTVSHIQGFGYLYMLSALLDNAAVADASASRLFLMPFILLQAGWGSMAVAHGARLVREGRHGHLLREQISVSLLLLGALACYVLVVIVFADLLGEILLTEEYVQSMDLIGYWAVVFAFNIIMYNGSFGLQALREFRFIARANVMTMIVTIILSYVLILQYETKGAIVALAIGQALLGMVLWYRFWRSIAIARTC